MVTPPRALRRDQRRAEQGWGVPRLCCVLLGAAAGIVHYLLTAASAQQAARRNDNAQSRLAACNIEYAPPETRTAVLW